MKRLILMATVLAVGLLPAAALGKGGLETFLTNAAEVPKASTKASGESHVTFTSTSVCWRFTNLKGVANPVAAHIHKAPRGRAGPVVVAFGATFKLTGCVKTPAAVRNAIQRNRAHYYVNVHTKKYPAGAIRGQLDQDDD